MVKGGKVTSLERGIKGVSTENQSTLNGAYLDILWQISYKKYKGAS
jgi:hypothetical protein